MSLYRIKQFLWSLSFKLDPKELAIIRKNLTDKEIDLFSKLSIGEQKHCIRVVNSVNIEISKIKRDKDIQIDEKNLIKAAFLHDIGKIHTRLNVIDKSILVILNKVTNGYIKRFTSCKKIDIYYNHAYKGANLLRELGYNEKIVELVEGHHSENKSGIELDILKYCDSIN